MSYHQFQSTSSPSQRLKTALAKCLNRLKDKSPKAILEDEEFVEFHVYRNYFNQGLTMTKLEAVDTPSGVMFRDNTKDRGLWTELSALGNAYHTDEYWKDVGRSLTYNDSSRASRKFLKEYDLPGYKGCTQEMIIDRTGFRVTTGAKMETFNFGAANALSSAHIPGREEGETLYSGLHYKFDMYPHDKLYSKFGYQEFAAGQHIAIVDMASPWEKVKGWW